MRKQSTTTTKIRAMLGAGKTVKEIAAKLKIKPAAVYQVRHKMAKEENTPTIAEIVEAMNGLGQVDEKAVHEVLATPVHNDPVNHPLHEVLATPIDVADAADHPAHYDPVNHPPHYKAGGIETIDFIEAKQFGYHLGNVIKYITRAYHKGGMEDLLKAQWYLNRAIEKGEV